MGIVDHGDGIHPYAKWLIKWKAQQLVGKYGFTKPDREDIEQDLIVDLLTRQGSYDLKRSQPQTFISRIVDNHVVTLIRKRKADKRDYRTPVESLDEQLGDNEGEGISRHEVVDQDDYLLMTDRATRAQSELLDLKLDVQLAVSKLPPLLQLIALLLQEMKVGEVAKATGLPQATVSDNVKRIQQLFERMGVLKKVEKDPVKTEGTE